MIWYLVNLVLWMVAFKAFFHFADKRARRTAPPSPTTFSMPKVIGLVVVCIAGFVFIFSLTIALNS